MSVTYYPPRAGDISDDTNLAVTTPITLTDDSVGMVDQGTTTTVLHGNASGNPSFAAVDTDDIAADAITQAKIDALAVDTTELAADAVDGTKLADDAVGAEHIETLDDDIVFSGTGKFVRSTSLGSITATGSSQGDAAAITNTVTWINAGAADTGVILPAATGSGRMFFIANITTTAHQIYPASGDKLRTTADLPINCDNSSYFLGHLFIDISSSGWIVIGPDTTAL